MAALANNTPIAQSPRCGLRWPVNNGHTLYSGSLAFVGASGLLIAWSDLATTLFVGIATDKVVGTASNPECPISSEGMILEKINVVGVSALDDLGDLVFALNDNPNDCTLTANTNQKAIGFVSRYYGSGTKCDIYLFSAAEHRALY